MIMRHFFAFLIIFLFALNNVSAWSMEPSGSSDVVNTANDQSLIKAPLNPDFIKAALPSAYSPKKFGIQTITSVSAGKILGYKPSPHDLSHLKNPAGIGVQSADHTPLGYAPSYDLRAQSKLTSVKDQGDICGACWTFTALGSMESLLLPGESWDFSENNLKNTHGFDYGHCVGGNQDMAIAYLARWDGPKKDSDDPYNESSNSSPSGLTTQKHLQEAVYIPSRTSSADNDAIKSALINYGAVDSNMYWDGAKYNDPAYYYNGALTDANHAILIVGWNDNYSSANFSPAAPGNGAFIIKNSWGSAWGDGGYFYISYYDGNLARKTNTVYNVIQSASNYAGVYQYDTLGWTGDIGYNDSVAHMANIFTAIADNTLSAVSFYTNDTNVAYEVKVYGNVTAGQPVSGTLLTSASGSFANAGYHSVSISPSIVLSGQKFSIIVKITNSSYSWPVATEEPVGGYSSLATANAGESYVSEDGNVWEDITGIF
ncbi:MAG: hypothetical protein KAI33_10970, partial [Elusimicrobiales bacterium]|nr:hypothetical protein [Elusimicrobiales bacterium]